MSLGNSWLLVSTLLILSIPVHGIPLFLTFNRQEPPLERRAPEECDNLFHCRTIFSIIWSSLTVTIACVWTSMHPNVPDPSKVGWFAQRIELTVYGLVAPELVAARAFSERVDVNATIIPENTWLRQRFQALNTRISQFWPSSCLQWGNQDTAGSGASHSPAPAPKFDKGQIMHANFLNMGGFVDKCGVTITATHLDLDGVLNEILEVEEKDIKDRAKSDSLSKSLIVLQTLWFVVQCIARALSGLTITEIELSTLSFVAINCFTYAFWYHKPRLVQYPIRLKCSLIDDTTPSVKQPHQKDEAVPEKVAETTINVETNTDANDTVADKGIHQKKSGRRDAWEFWQSIPILGLAIEATRHIQPHVQPFSVRLWSDARPDPPVAAPTIIVGFVTSLVFGGIHLFGWNFFFPSHTEQIMWRVCSIILVVAPPLFVLHPHPKDPRPTTGSDSSFTCHTYMKYWAQIILAKSAVPCYIVARLTLLAICFSSLRRLPFSAYQTVSWVTFIPHL